MKIKYKISKGLELQRNGAMIDLVATEDYTINKGEHTLIELGISMQLPKYIMAITPPRSGLFGNTGLIVVNSFGVIDPPISNRTNIKCKDVSKLLGYIGDGDTWKCNTYKLTEGTITIKKGERLSQFHLMPVMDCPWWITLKWIFKRKLEFVQVDVLGNKNRGGFGSTN